MIFFYLEFICFYIKIYILFKPINILYSLADLDCSLYIK